MLQSKLFAKTQRTVPKDEKSVNAILLIRAGYVDKLMAGVYSFLPLGWRVMFKIANVIRHEMNKIGAQELYLAALHPKENWQQTGRWNSFEGLYRFKDRRGRNLALGPTHEEIIVPLAKKIIATYRDLPIYVYQIQIKFREELRAKSGLLRLREFIMKDLYSFHRDEKDLDRYYEEVKKAYERICKRVGIKERTFLTLASGGTFSKFSHEFQTITPAGEDFIYICQNCSIAINKEIKKNYPKCPNCGSSSFKQEKAIEVGNIFKLRTKYSQPFNLSFKNEKGKEKLVEMGCYGIGLDRLMGTVVEVHHDEKGIVWPKDIAPFKFHLLQLDKQAKVRSLARKVYRELSSLKDEILFDDRENKSAAEKLVDSDLLGIPYKIIVSQRNLEKKAIEVKERRSGHSKFFKMSELKKFYLLN